MGIYFIAAGTSSNNRFKSLEKAHSLDSILPFLDEQDQTKLKAHFGKNDPVYAWGATHGSRHQLRKVDANEYVVDVKDKEVPYIFRFCFWFEPKNKKLQEYIGWDAEEEPSKKRNFKYVYFLKDRLQPKNRDKNFFQNSFSIDTGNTWLRGQKYYGDYAVNQALEATNSKTIEEYLGIDLPIEKRPGKQKKGNAKPEIQNKSGGLLYRLINFFRNLLK